MNDFTADIKRAINTTAKNALKLCADELNRLAEPRVPVWQGTLRRSMRVRIDGNNVYVVSGNARTPYASKQYYESLRHRGTQEQLLDLTALYRDAGGARRKTGRGKKYLYGRAYRLAVESGALQKLDAPRWYERTIERPEVQQILSDIFVGTVQT